MSRRRALSLAIARRLINAAASRLERDGSQMRLGRRLDPQVRAAIWLQRRSPLPAMETQEPARARKTYLRQALPFCVPSRPMARQEVIEAQGERGPLTAKLLVPPGAPSPAPALVYFHGGGFTIGGIETHEPPCRWLAEVSGCAVLMMTYRLAPEHPFPAAPHDVRALWRWVLDNAARLGLDPERLAVGGDSAGGNLAAGLCQWARDHDVPSPAFQLLIYPSTDRLGVWPSHQHFGQGYLLDDSLRDWFINLYLGDWRDDSDPRLSPLRASSLAGLPPAHMALAGFDPLVDEGLAYARAMEEAGVEVEVALHEGLVHGFLHLGGIVDEARHALDRCGVALRRGLGA